MCGGLVAGQEVLFPRWTPFGRNLALGKPYTPDQSGYPLCADPGDKTQLTDGAYAPGGPGMWHFKETVGWSCATIPLIVDLGEICSIGGLSFSSETSPEAGVGLPRAILILVSDDGKAYRRVGELIALAARYGAPPERGRYTLRTDGLNCRGRFLQLVIQSSLHIFVDEVEVYEGSAAFLDQEPQGPIIDHPVQHLETHVTGYAAAAWSAIDAARARERLAALGISPTLRNRLFKRLDDIHRKSVQMMPELADPEFRAIVPIHSLQADVLSVMAEGYRAAGYPEHWVWHTNRWLRLSHWDIPPPPKGGGGPALRMHQMQEERRGEVFSIANFSPIPKTATVRFHGLPGGAVPECIRVLQAEFVAQQSRYWDANALPAAEKTDGGWRITLPVGISRQVWLDVWPRRPTCPPGLYKGEVVVAIEEGGTFRIPLELKVSSIRMPPPRERAIAIGVWDYTAKGGAAGYGLHPGNVQAAIAHMKGSGVNAPWAMNDWASPNVFPPHGALDSEGRMDFSAFDQWVDQWPDAKYYMIYSGFHWGLIGKEWGQTDPEIQRQFGERMKAWAEHLRNRRINPSRVALLLVDEPGGGDADALTLAGAAVIKTETPEFLLYIDPVHGAAQYEDPVTRKMFEHMDIITPGCPFVWGQPWGEATHAFYDQWRRKGKIMGYYSCAQNPSEADAIGYYRMQQWHCWKINGGGSNSWAGFWAYADVRGNSSWNPLDSGRDKNWSPVYIDSKSVTDSKHWLAIFEGQQDYEYLLTLKNKVELLEKSKAHPSVASARRLLETVADETIAAVYFGRETAERMDFERTDVYAEMRRLGRGLYDIEACDRGRLRVLEALERLGEVDR